MIPYPYLIFHLEHTYTNCFFPSKPHFLNSVYGRLSGSRTTPTYYHFTPITIIVRTIIVRTLSPTARFKSLLLTLRPSFRAAVEEARLVRPIKTPLSILLYLLNQSLTSIKSPHTC
jgi:hypothetical protein